MYLFHYILTLNLLIIIDTINSWCSIVIHY